MKTNLRTHRSSRLKWVAALFFAFGIGNALPVSANFSPADELAIPNTTRSNREVNFNRNWKFFLDETDKLYTDEGNGMSDMALHIKTLEIIFSLYLPSLTDMQKAVLKQTIRPVTMEDITPLASVGTARHSTLLRIADIPKPPSISKGFT